MAKIAPDEQFIFAACHGVFPVLLSLQISFVLFNAHLTVGGLTSLFQTELTEQLEHPHVRQLEALLYLTHTHTHMPFTFMRNTNQRGTVLPDVARVYFLNFDHAFSLDPCSP